VFFTFFPTPVSQKLFEISKCAKQVNHWKFYDQQIWFYQFFDIWNGFWDISKKLFKKKTFVSCYGFLKCLDLGQITLFFVFGCFFPFIAGNLVSSGQHSHLNVSVILGVGVGTFSRCFEPLYLKNCWTYQNEHGSIRSSSAPFFLLSIPYWLIIIYLLL